MSSKKPNTPARMGALRIIGGSLRSRRFRFEETAGLRPTPDRVRETLFNWLNLRVRDSRCLDLFAGSGALGFEAASRGARSVTLVESQARACSRLEENRRNLGLENIDIHQRDAFRYLRSATGVFDIVFLDPPFDADAVRPALELIGTRGILAEDGVVYVERRNSRADTSDIDGWDTLKRGRAGEVDFRLITPTMRNASLDDRAP